MVKYLPLTENEKRTLKKYRRYYDLSVIESALQKGVRRNVRDLVAWSLRESFLFYVLDKNVAFNTNIIDKLRLIAVEDCSPRALIATNECMRNLERYHRTNGPEHLIKAGQCLAECPSSRVCAHLREVCEGNHVEEDRMTHKERMSFIFSCILLNTSNNVSPLMNLRFLVVYHLLKAYKENNNNLSLFWDCCFNTVKCLAKNNNRVKQYENELNYALTWRQNFYVKDSLFLVSALELLIAVAHGPKEEFDEINNIMILDVIDGAPSPFDWVNEHNRNISLPSYVFDEYTSTRPTNPTYNGIIEGQKVIDGDVNWTPKLWLLIYNEARMKEKQEMINRRIDALLLKEEKEGGGGVLKKRKRKPDAPLLLKEGGGVLKKRKRKPNNNDDDDDDDDNFIKDLTKLPRLQVEEIENVVEIHKNNNKATMKMVDGSFVVLKHMKKSFGAHQNFIQNLKDNNNICDFQYLRSTPDSGKYRGLATGNFTIEEGGLSSSSQSNVVYFMTGYGNTTKKLSSQKNRIYCINRTYYLDLVHIIAFRMLLGVNNTNQSNITYDKEGKLYSVDENKIGAITMENMMKTKALQSLRVYIHILSDFLDDRTNAMKTIKSSLPVWMFDEEKRQEMMKKINIQGEKDGISKTTLDLIADNAKKIGQKLLNFLFSDKIESRTYQRVSSSS